MSRYLNALLAVLAVAACVMAGLFHFQSVRLDSNYNAAVTQRDRARADADAALNALAVERDRTERVVRAAQEAEERTNEIKAESDRLVADLRAGNVKLRKQWQAYIATDGLSDSTAAAAEPREDADDRAASAGRIVRAAADCDAQVTGLQRAYNALRD